MKPRATPAMVKDQNWSINTANMYLLLPAKPRWAKIVEKSMKWVLWPSIRETEHPFTYEAFSGFVNYLTIPVLTSTPPLVVKPANSPYEMSPFAENLMVLPVMLLPL